MNKYRIIRIYGDKKTIVFNNISAQWVKRICKVYNSKNIKYIIEKVV